MAVDLSGIAYFAPLWAFLIVVAVVYAVLSRTELLGESKFLNVFVSFLIGTMFVTLAGVREYVLTIVPWFAILLISLFLILIVLGMVGEETKSLHRGLGVAFLVLLVIVFLVAGLNVFSENLAPYLPGSGAIRGGFVDWLYSPRIIGAVLLLGISAIVSWVLVREGGKKGD